MDSAISAGRSDTSNGTDRAAVLFPTVEPRATPVYGPDIVSELEEIVRCFVVLSSEAAVAGDSTIRGVESGLPSL